MRRTLTATVACALCAAPVAHAEPSVTPDRGCYVPGEPIVQTGQGFTAGASLEQSVDVFSMDLSEVLVSLRAPAVATDASGAFTAEFAAPALQRAGDRAEFGVSSFADPATPDADPAADGWIVSDWNMDVRAWHDGRADPRRRMTVRTWGWTSAGDTLYAHYLRAGHRVRTVRVGDLTGACGDLRIRMREFPFRHVRPGRWRVYFTATPALHRRTDRWISWTVRVR